jgi:hypothetical protein
MEHIAQDIKECGSACDVYLKKSFIGTLLPPHPSNKIILKARLSSTFSQDLKIQDL